MCLRGIQVTTGFGLAVEIGAGPGSGRQHRLLSRPGTHRTVLRPSRRQDRSRRPPAKTPANCSSRRHAAPAPYARPGERLLQQLDQSPRPPRSGLLNGSHRLPQMGSLRCPQETLRHGQHRDRAGTGRLVLVPGRALTTRAGATNERGLTKTCPPSQMAAARGQWTVHRTPQSPAGARAAIRRHIERREPLTRLTERLRDNEVRPSPEIVMPLGKTRSPRQSRSFRRGDGR